MVEQYQTRWVRGKADGNGVRECADRYEIIKSIAKQFNRPFTVLDIGANLGYFSFRLMEDFDNCHAVMVEGHPTYARQLTELAGINGQGIVLTKSLTQGDLGLLGDVEHFDLVLAMSVVHHINGDVNRTCRLIENLGDNVIFEMPTENNACGQRLVQSWEIGEHWERLGEGKSHLDGGVRPIFLSQQSRTRLGQRYIGCPKHLKPRLKIISDWDSKEVMFMDDKEPRREWLPGINLHTWKYFQGTKPVPFLILDDVRKELGSHGDVRPWNVIVSSNAATLIDYSDPTHIPTETDDVSFQKLENWFAGEAPHWVNL